MKYFITIGSNYLVANISSRVYDQFSEIPPYVAKFFFFKFPFVFVGLDCSIITNPFQSALVELFVLTMYMQI